MDGTIYLHDLDSYKSVGNCLTAPFVDLLSVGFAPSSSNRKDDLDYFTVAISKISQIQKERNNYDKIEKEYYL